MEKEQRTRLQKATQDARRLLEEEFRSQLLQTYDIDVEKVRWAEEPGVHLLAEQRLIREKLIAWIEHKEAQIVDRKEALLLALREMAFTALNRFVALKLMEARELVRPCVSGGLESAGFLEFTAVAQGLLADQESSYRLYLETIFEDVSRELRALFDPRDPASLLWPKRAALLELLDILNRPELAELWSEDETLGWVYQYFNGDAERKKMREESAAPRNSRELAVRNQFFTPRYVVEFLTDNTLGRIWYEMRQGQTGLKDRCRYLVRRPTEIWLQPGEKAPAQPDTDEAFSQEEILRQPVHILHRELKDPREIRMLDPACGSMHFGLYAFDLYLEIYEEAWDIAQGPNEQVKKGDSFASFATFASSFADKACYIREVPRLILQHNIHGIDVDSRATQIAKLTLWLRAQRAWHEQKVSMAERPTITRSNIVCAEPMPGEEELLEEFVDEQFTELERGIYFRLLGRVIGTMRIAGESGSLLKIEEEIDAAIHDSRSLWQSLAVHQQELFELAELPALGAAAISISSDIEGLSSKFWVGIEDKIIQALRDYSEIVEQDSKFKRRLFADDAASGFAFIDVLRSTYDVALMNPPFGSPSRNSKASIKKAYPETWQDIYAAFAERMQALLAASGGLLGAITPNSWMVSRQLRDFRSRLVDDHSLSLMAELGTGVMDSAAVEVCLWIAKSPDASSSFSYVLDLLSKDPAHRPSLLDPNNRDWNIVDLRRFAQITDSPFCYYTEATVLERWKQPERLQPDVATIVKGNATWDDFRFLRLWFEVPHGLADWRTYKTGGEYEPFAECSSLVMNWKNGGDEIRANAIAHSGSDAQTMQSSKFWDLPGLALPFHGGKIGVRVSRAGEVIAQTVVFMTCNNADDYLPLLGILNSPCLDELYQVRGRRRYKDTIIFKDLPISRDDIQALAAKVAPLSEAAALYARFAHETDETERLFRGYDKNVDHMTSIEQTITRSNQFIAESINSINALVSQRLSLKGNAPCSDGGESSSEELRGPTNPCELLVSVCMGLSFGRWSYECHFPWDPYLRSHDSLSSLKNEFFEALPVWPIACGRPLAGHIGNDPQAGSNNDSECSPIDSCPAIVSSEDLPALLGATSLRAWKSDIDEVFGQLIGRANSLSSYLVEGSGFFADHLKRYSKNRRQAPIYWLLSGGNGSYSAWLYYHRFSQDTLYLLLHEFVEPRIQQAEREQFELDTQGSLSGDAALRLQETQALLQDLRILKSELDLVAPLWNPNLNDGVIINHAILWRITPYTPWQKKCKECWDKLVKGDYDWAHLAFHLWPERVIPKCITDRSLAIAHGLEERLWQETSNGNWLPRQLTEADLQALIAEHSNPAVKSALERFLAAAPPVAPTRTRASRSTRSAGSSAPRRPRGPAAVVDAEATRQVLLALTAAPSDGLAKAAIADLIGVEANALTAVIKQLKDSGQIDQLGERRGARYVLSEQGRAAVASQSGEED
jgi:hypothetical protein